MNNEANMDRLPGYLLRQDNCKWEANHGSNFNFTFFGHIHPKPKYGLRIGISMSSKGCLYIYRITFWSLEKNWKEGSLLPGIVSIVSKEIETIDGRDGRKEGADREQGVRPSGLFVFWSRRRKVLRQERQKFYHEKVTKWVEWMRDGSWLIHLGLLVPVFKTIIWIVRVELKFRRVESWLSYRILRGREEEGIALHQPFILYCPDLCAKGAHILAKYEWEKKGRRYFVC